MAQPTSAEYFCTAISDVTQTISEKCQVLGDILATSQSKFQVIERDARDKVFHQMPLIQEMDRVFQQLRGSAVAAAARSPSPSPPSDPLSASSSSSPNKTLFDYVDAETVQSLQQDAADQAKEIDDMLTMHRDALDRIGVIYQYFSSFQNKFGTQIHHAMQAPTSHHDAKALEYLYDACVRFFVDMEQCDRFLLRYFSTINDVYPHYEPAIAEAETLFDELRSLQDFYRQFHISYQHLGREFERRHRYEDKVHKLLNDTMAKLQIYEQEEHQARASFIHEHARYLPTSLCPELKTLPDQYDIVPVPNEPSN